MNPAPRWVAPLFAVLGAALIPWTVYLAMTLPPHARAHHYRAAWVGFDTLLVAVLLLTAYLAARGRPLVGPVAASTATMLLVDAWFDVTTARHGWPFLEALTLALLVELPLAALCLYIAHRVERVSEREQDQRRAG
jgi:hypothetical protein